MSISSSKNRAFTLIELLVVIAIIGILTGIILTNLTSAKAKARDAKRISDLGNIQLAVELYFDRCKQYPPALDVGTATDCTTSTGTVNLGTYMSVIPTSPSPGTYDYAKLTDASGKIADYALHTQLEYTNEVVKDSLPASYFTNVPAGSTWANIPTCDQIKEYCLGSK